MLQLVVGEQIDQRARQRALVAGRHDQAGLAVAHQPAGRGADRAAGDHRRRLHHRLVADQTPRLEEAARAQRRHDQRRRRRVGDRQQLALDPAGDAHAANGGRARRQWPVADHAERRVTGGVAVAPGAQQRFDALLAHQPSAEQRDRLVVATPRPTLNCSMSASGTSAREQLRLDGLRGLEDAAAIRGAARRSG